MRGLALALGVLEVGLRGIREKSRNRLTVALRACSSALVLEGYLRNTIDFSSASLALNLL